MRGFSAVESLEARRMFTASLVADNGGVYPRDSVLAASGDTYFVADDGKHGDQLWVSDGTVAGTEMVTNFASGIGSPTLVAFGNGVAFLGTVGLWKSDGTAAGTVEIAAEPAENVLQASLESANGHLVFITTPELPVPNSASIWASDGSVGNLQAIQQINNVRVENNLATYIYAPVVTGNHVIYPNIYSTVAATGEIWSTDGTAAGTIQLGGTDAVAVGQVTLGGRYLYWEQNLGLFSTDGTPDGTQLISNVQPMNYDTYGETSINPYELASYAGVQTIADGHYFFAVPSQSGFNDSSTEVWESDGTAAGTHSAFTVSGSYSEVSTSANGIVVFADTISHLTNSDGSPDIAATYTLYSFDPDSGSLSSFYQFADAGIVKSVTIVDNSIYFYYWDGATQDTAKSITFSNMPNFQLWRTDGTAAGTSYLQTYSYWPELTPVDHSVVVSDAPNETIGQQIIEPEAPATVHGMTQNAVSLIGGILRVFGTDGDDNIRVYQQDADRSRLVVDLDEVKHSFAISEISEMKIYGEDGNDSIAFVEGHGKIGIRTYVDGGAGNDRIYTGGGRDTIDGGAGNDYINGGNNNDVINGDDGNDTLIGGNGDDAINGGDGSDFVEGNKGNNILSGGDDDSVDTIIGNGHDVLFGQTAIDVFFNGTSKIDPLDTMLD